MKVLKKFDKCIKDWHILTFLGLIVLGYIIYEYSLQKNMLVTNYQGVTGQQKLNPAQMGQLSPSGASKTNASLQNTARQLFISLPDKYFGGGEYVDLLKKCNLDPEGIAKSILKNLNIKS